MAASRLALLQTEIVRRQATGEKFGFILPGWTDPAESGAHTHLLVAATDSRERARLVQALGRMATVTAASDVEAAETALSAGDFDAAVLAMAPDAMRDLYKRARETEAPRSPSILFLTNGHDTTPLPGVATDTMHRPWRTDDLRTRLRLLIGRAHYARAVRHLVQSAYAPVAIDTLTGLYSHSFLHDHLTGQISDASQGGNLLSVGYFGVDGIEQINQQSGYAAGDRLLHQVGLLIGHLTRTEDLAARDSGAHFCVTLFDTDLAGAGIMSNRLASIIGYTQFAVANLEEPVGVGIRTGVASLCPGDTAATLIARAAQDAARQP